MNGPVVDVKQLQGEVRERNQLREALELLLEHGMPTDTYCEYCDSHAPKELSRDEQQMIYLGPITHKKDCVRGIAELALGKTVVFVAKETK